MTNVSGAKISCAIIGPGNIGTDLMIKIMRNSRHLEMGAMVGIDPTSDGLARAARLGVAVTHEGIEGLRKLPNYAEQICCRRQCGVAFEQSMAFPCRDCRCDAAGFGRSGPTIGLCAADGRPAQIRPNGAENNPAIVALPIYPSFQLDKASQYSQFFLCHPGLKSRFIEPEFVFSMLLMLCWICNLVSVD
jgi:hypothetical protein